jgi:ribose transport system ATP-binding protein
MTLLQVQVLSKAYSGVEALTGVSLEVRDHEIVGLVGENGAGKSTLLNVLSGVITPDEGEIIFKGSTLRLQNYHQANTIGIFRVFQEQALVPNLTVYENLFLSHEEHFTGISRVLNRRAMMRQARGMLTDIGLDDVDVTLPIRVLDFGQRQAVEIARAALLSSLLEIETPLVLLDEPTTALDQREGEIFLKLLRRLKARASVVFVSHRLQEVLETCDRLYVLKDGHLVASVDPSEVDEGRLHELMVGRARTINYYHEHRQRSPNTKLPRLRAERLSLQSAYTNISFELHEGEVLGIGGVHGSGKEELGQSIAGILVPDMGTIEIDGKRARRPEFVRLISQGLAYIPAERQREGLIVDHSILSNVQMASLQDLFTTRMGIWRAARARETTRKYVRDLKIQARSIFGTCNGLSGGNQQKVLLAKWLCRDPRVLILDNPTRGVDTGARETIYELIRSLCEHGASVILITDDLPELIGLSNRILIMVNGRVSEVLPAAADRKPSEQDVVTRMIAAHAGNFAAQEALQE